MSQSVSSASRTIATSLTDIEIVSTMTAIKTIGFIILFFVLCCCFTSMMFPPIEYRHRCTTEDFTNTTEPAPFAKITFDKYQKIPLTAPDSVENTPLNLLFGQASRRITANKTTIEISANLYILNGSLFDKAPNVDHIYKAYLDGLEIGSLEKKGDGMYYLVYSTVQQIEDLTTIKVQYEQEGISPIVLIQGNFSNLK
jgi:hypothetical protein